MQKEELKKRENARIEKQVWEFINRYRKVREPVNKGIEMEEWRRYFMGLLNGTDTKFAGGWIREEIDEETNDRKIEDKQIMKQIRKLKKGKATGEDGIPNEAWIFIQARKEQEVCELLKKVWKGEGIPEDWKIGIISPLYKKGDKDKAENYRGITLLNTAYKLYAMEQNERMKEEIKEKGILPDTQAEFRKGRGTIDNIFILRHAAEKELSRKGGKLFTFFVDLKAAFDKINRQVLWAAMEKRGIRKGLVERVKELCKECKRAF